MIPLEEARAFVLDRCDLLPVELVPIDDALNLVTAENLEASGPIPPFDNTAMDGFAVRAADVADAPTTLRIVGTIAAGARPSFSVGPGDAARIMTGAPIPAGADAVIMVELTTTADDGKTVSATKAVPQGNHIRLSGDDVTAGEVVFEAGTTLRSAHIGVCSSIGRYEVPVYSRPRVGVLSTGDELVDTAAELDIGQIHDSNRHMLLALLRSMGATPVDFGVVADDEDLIREALLDAAAKCDAVVTSGGVSMGDFDYVKTVLTEIGDMRWMQVAIKPAKPLAFGTVGSTPIFGLPGNPVSALVSFELFAKPGIHKLMGYPEPVPPPLRGVAAVDLVRRPDGKTHFARVNTEQRLDGLVAARLVGGQGSHQLSSAANASALAVLPNGEGIAAGDPVDLLMLV